MDRSKLIREFFDNNPDCTTPSECDKYVAEQFECSENAARSARYRVYPKSGTRPWNDAAEQQDGTWFEGDEKAVPTSTVETGKGRPRLVFEAGFPRTELPHVCPKTGTTANSLEEADELFGWRCTGEHDDGTPKYIVQSWCRQARADMASARRA